MIMSLKEENEKTGKHADKYIYRDGAWFQWSEYEIVCYFDLWEVFLWERRGNLRIYFLIKNV